MQPLRAALLALPLLACAADPAGDYLFGFGDPVRGAALYAPQRLGNMAQYRGDPAGAALAAAQLEFLTQQFDTNPRYAPEVNPAVTHQLHVARAEMRAAIGMAPDTPPEVAITLLRRAAAALRAGRLEVAEAALSGPAFPLGPRATLA
ncbi:MAG TPA: hypothetical protein VE684_06595, partial [Crenalkalicoccus sp.]|nr:hypothetical protein [Crenalkalicoccus sp.]